MLQNIIKIILGILFLLCLHHMPYSYYQGVRFAGLLGFALLAYKSYEQKKVEVMIVYIGLAVLFQPFVKVALGKGGWHVVDVVVAVGLIVSAASPTLQRRD